MARAHLVDTSVLAYALGDEHPERSACRHVIELAADGQLELHASVEMVQELLHHRMRRGGRSAALRQARAAAELCVLHPFDEAVLVRALELVATSTMRGRDAVHAATGLTVGLSSIITSDHDFDEIAGLIRIAPSEVP